MIFYRRESDPSSAKSAKSSVFDTLLATMGSSLGTMRLALIGNCAYQALIDDSASVRWLCWPRFDSSFVFGSLLDEGRGGELSIRPAAPARSKQAYVRNTNILRTVFEGEDGAFEVVDFAPRHQSGGGHYKPTILVRIVRPLEGTPSVRIRCRPVYDYGEQVPHGRLEGGDISWRLGAGVLRLQSNLPSGACVEGEPVVLERDLYLALGWGDSLEGALGACCERLLSRTMEYWQGWVAQMRLPEGFRREVIRSALVLKLHQFEETGAITAASTTSLVEFPGSGRCWDYRYCWLRDAYFTVDALRRLDHFAEVEGLFSFVQSVASKGPLQPLYGIGGERQLPERIVEHLAGYLGEGPVRIGNAASAQEQHDVYGETIAAIAPLLLEQAKPPVGALRLVGRLVDRIEETMGCPDAGLWEIRDEPKVHTFSLLMHWLGGKTAACVGAHVGDGALERRGRALAKRARKIIEECCYRPACGYYADSTSTDHADAALLMMVNAGFLEADQPRTAQHLAALHERLSLGNSLMRRYRHHDGIGQTHGTFTVCGFWYAEALARIGRRQEAECCVTELIGHANHVGLFSEDIDPRTGKQWGNFPQTYSHAGLITATLAISAQPLPG